MYVWAARPGVTIVSRHTSYVDASVHTAHVLSIFHIYRINHKYMFNHIPIRQSYASTEERTITQANSNKSPIKSNIGVFNEGRGVKSRFHTMSKIVHLAEDDFP